jgi:hypothetical protein
MQYLCLEKAVYKMDVGQLKPVYEVLQMRGSWYICLVCVYLAGMRP